MNTASRAYRWLLWLYPQPFRNRFGTEMEEVFNNGLAEARAGGNAGKFMLRELLKLPFSLADVYLWAMRTEGGGQMAYSGASAGGNSLSPVKPEGWLASLLAGLPYLLLASFYILGGIVSQASPNLVNWLLVPIVVILLSVFIFGMRSGWGRWSASWTGCLLLFILGLLTFAMKALDPVIHSERWLNDVQAIIFPILLAYLLYKIASVDRLAGMLAAILPSAFIWAMFNEFVPQIWTSLNTIWISLLAFAASFGILRSRNHFKALLLALAVPLIGGIPFVVLSVYKGGTLPFSEPGPSLWVVTRQYLPFLVMSTAIILGPQLAVELRKMGRAAAAGGGKVSYRLALAGILFGTLLVLDHFNDYPFLLRLAPRIDLGSILLVIAAGFYLTGFALLAWTLIQPAADKKRLITLAALFVLLPGVPVVIFTTFPGVLSGHYVPLWIVVLELLWVIASVWLVKDQA